MTDTSMDVYRVDVQSQARVGLRSQALGFPLSGMVYGNLADAEAFADRVVAAQANIVNRPTSLAVDTRTDPGWLPVLAALDTGDSLLIRRTGLPADTPDPLEYRCVVVGIEHSLSSLDGWSATIHLTTIEETF